jgi:hypothetical protein
MEVGLEGKTLGRRRPPGKWLSACVPGAWKAENEGQRFWMKQFRKCIKSLSLIVSLCSWGVEGREGGIEVLDEAYLNIHQQQISKESQWKRARFLM